MIFFSGRLLLLGILPSLTITHGMRINYCHKEYIKPCTCNRETQFGIDVECIDVEYPENLKVIIDQFESSEIRRFTLQNSHLDYIPGKLFIGKGLQELKLDNVIFRKFINKNYNEDPEHIFNGTETSLKKIQLMKIHYNLDLSELGVQLHQLNSLIIHDGELTEIEPLSHVAPNVEILLIANHKIHLISETAFSNMTKLKKVVLRSNLIRSMKRSMLPRPANNLHCIDLGKNMLEGIDDDMFEDMPFLKSLILDDNKIRRLEEKPMMPIWNTLGTFRIKGNPIQCTKEISWIIEATKTKRSPNLKGICCEPLRLKGKELNGLKMTDLLGL